MIPVPTRSQYHKFYDENPLEGLLNPTVFPESGARNVFRCSFCHQYNPAGIAECQHCGAVLDQPVGPAMRSPEVQTQVLKLLAEGSKIAAIKWFRENTGAGLKEAKDAVEAIDRGSPVAFPAEVDESLEREVEALLQSGQKINAIKRYRERTGVGLKEAKDAVERQGVQLGIPVVERSGCLAFMIAALFMIMVEGVLRLLT